MTEPLKEPEAYLVRLAAMQAKRPEQWPKLQLSLERKKNRHPETDGQPWGWYEILPMGVSVGYWGSQRDDLKNVDIADWNRRAILATADPCAVCHSAPCACHRLEALAVELLVDLGLSDWNDETQTEDVDSSKVTDVLAAFDSVRTAAPSQ